jgi:uroporphyrinogen-III synthase
MESLLLNEDLQVDLLHGLGIKGAGPDAVQEVLAKLVEFASALVKCDSCMVFILEEDELVLRASNHPHPSEIDRLKLRVGQGVTGWVAVHREPVSITRRAWQDPRFLVFKELPEDNYEAFLSVPLLSRGRVVGVINLQHRQPHIYTRRQIKLISTAGFLVGAEIELARLEQLTSSLAEQLQTRKLVERAKGILQRDLHLSEEQSYIMLQRQSRQRRKSMKEVAEAIILSSEVKEESRN